MPNQPTNTLKSTQHTLRIIEAIRDAGGLRITVLANELDLAKSTIHNHLATLEQNGYVVNEGGTYHIGLKFLILGRHARERNRATIPARRWVEQLSQHTDEEIDFVVEENGLAFQLYHDLDSLDTRTRKRMGQFYYMHSTAVGKAIFSALPDSRVHDILDTHGLPAQTPNTITDRDILSDELKMTRDRGYAINDEESTNGLRAVATPIQRPSGVVCGAISITGPTYRITVDDLHEMAGPLLKTKREAETDLKS